MVEALMFVTGLFVFRGWLDEVRPIEHCPNHIVAVLARHGSDVAVEELEQRCGSGTLSERQRHGAADVCFAELGRFKPSPARAACINLLTQMDAAGDLDPLQTYKLDLWSSSIYRSRFLRLEMTWPPPGSERKIWDKPGKWTPPDIIGIGSWIPHDIMEVRPKRPGGS